LIFSYEFAGLWSLLLFSLPLFIVWRSHKLFEEMKEAHINTVAALTTALEADEPYTHGHSWRVAKYAVMIGRELGMSDRELEILEYGGLLHDIGKIAITNDIVCKPARLTKEEFDILAAHPAIGGEIVAQMKFLKDAGDLVRHHHERPDGQGYPDGLVGDQISLGSHILNVCDAIDAMTSNRPYRAALTQDNCIAELKRFRGTQFDERVVDALERMVNDGRFELIPQTDGSAMEIQRILREAAQPFALVEGRDAAA
jgi:putative nucleotidyltransferase with HDIG domain